MPITARSSRIYLQGVLLALAALALTGCTALSITTQRAGQASTTTLKGAANISSAIGDASVTQPDTPRYADADAFVRSERALLARQAAAGGGESIDALAVLLHKPDQEALAHWMQSHYDELFSDRSVSATKIIIRIDAHAG